MMKRHWDKHQILPNFRRIMRPMMSVRLDRSSPSENGIVTSVVTASSLLESLGVTFDCCSKFEGKSWNERCFKGDLLFIRIHFWHSRSEQVIQTGLASCNRAFCTQDSARVLSAFSTVLVHFASRCVFKDFRSSDPICKSVCTNVLSDGFNLSRYLLSRHCVCKQSILGLVQ